MPSRLTGWSSAASKRVASLGSVKEEDVVESSSEFGGDHGFAMPAITPRFVDEAVESVLRESDLGPDTAQVMRDLLSRDDKAGVAYHFYHRKAKENLDEVFGRVAKQDVVLDYVLTDEETGNLVQYAPEFNITFRSRVNHDHAAAAASRVLDHKLILSRLPSGLTMSDVGGNPLFHIRQGIANRHVCNPVVDVKDPARTTIRNMEARMLSRSETVEPVVRELASQYVRRDPAFVCDKYAQQCHQSSQVITAIHVYDVPMQDWPMIMENKHAAVVEGALLFSPRFFEQVSGELVVAGARYEVDTEKDVIRMGFIDSPSWWYEHKWSAYMRYGVDQILQTPSGLYSYKVIERRGDTLFYRILRVSKGARVELNQYYELPDVDVVEVNGFSLDAKLDSRRALIPHTYRFPKPLWEDMVNHAELEYERGVMDFGKLFNYYRTIAPRQTINATLVMGGHSVEMHDLCPLIVHVGLAAAGAIMLSKRATRGVTDSVMQSRALADESTVVKLFEAFEASVVAVLGLPLWPLRAIGNLIKVGHKAIMSAKVMTWAPVARIRRINAVHMLSPTVDSYSNYRATGDFQVDHAYVEHAEARAPFDHLLVAMREPVVAKLMLEVCGGFLPRAHADKLKAVASTEGKPANTSKPSTAPPTYRTYSEQGQEVSEHTSDGRHERRLLAIREAIEEAEMENRKIVESCARAFVALTRRNEPEKSLLRKYAELHANPDFWYFKNGLVQKSALGLEPGDFRHAAVYAAQLDDLTGSHVMAVHDVTYEGPDSTTGEFVVREYKAVSNLNFTGWALTTDLLLVFNGPEILRSMQQSLDLRHDYDIVLEQGPPGCGKTTSIVNSVAPNDCVMCPVRESIIDTRARILDIQPNFQKSKLYVRTVDSYLVNYYLDMRTEALRADVLRADEAFMTHAGKWYAVAGLLGVKTVYAYGDKKQIPHIPRVQASKMYIRLEAQKFKEIYLTHRCPADSVAAWGHLYEHKVRTTSKVRTSMKTVKTSRGLEVPVGCVMMCMYQADKRALREQYANVIRTRRVKVVTAHEAEGKTYEHVWLHRFDTRKRTDDFSLFDKSEHVLVAMSRHTQTFVYVCPADVGDLVSTWMKKASSPRRCQAALDVASAGQSKEM